MTTEPIHSPKAVIDHTSADTLVLRLSGTWRIGEPIPSLADIDRQLSPVDGIKRTVLDTTELSAEACAQRVVDLVAGWFSES